MKVITFYNNKGGVAKTTSVLNIAYVFAHMGMKILVVDCDGQCNSSCFLSDDENTCGIENALINPDVTANSSLRKTRYENIDVLVSTENMNNAAYQVNTLSDNQRLRNAYKIIAENENKYDYIIIDLPPALNVISTTMLQICDAVFVPIELSAFSIQGVANVTEIISSTDVFFGGCFATKFDKGNSADIQMLELLKSSLGKKALSAAIPYSNVIKNSISMKKVAGEYRWGKAAAAYVNLANEINYICNSIKED